MVMDKHIVNKCSDCFHYEACKAMLVNFGIGDYISDSADADRCPDFVPTADIAIVRNGGWIPVAERLPDNEVDVLICAEPLTGRGRLISLAFYTDGRMTTEDSAYTWDIDNVDLDYDEEADAYIIPEGWWESVTYSGQFGAVDLHVTHWMPLPEPPEIGMKGGDV